MITKLDKFLSEALIYQKAVIFENYAENNTQYSTPYDFSGQTFEYFCEKEVKNTTFELGLEYENRFVFSMLPDEYFNGEYLDFTFTAICTCKSCKQHFVYC